MMTAEQVLQELAKLGSESYKKVIAKHGAKEPFYGVKVEDLKKFQKAIKKNHELALALYETGNSDAMYLAGLIADESKMTQDDLRRWASQAHWSMLREYTVASVAAESPHGFALAQEWIDSDDEGLASTGWATLANLVSIESDEDLDIPELAYDLDRVEKTIAQAPNRIRYVMNGFVMSVGSYVQPLTAKAKEVAKRIGKVSVDMGETACKVPDAVEMIAKVERMGRIGRKRKTARC